MRRLAALMTLIAALSGTPLRQAEAADDLCRSLLKLFQPASLDMPDGGVGDDSGIGTLSTPPCSCLANPLTSVAPLIVSPVSARSLVIRGDVDALRELIWSTPHPPNSRHAWLQALLF